MSENPLIDTSDLRKIRNGAEKVFALSNKVKVYTGYEWSVRSAVDDYCNISIDSVNGMIANAKAQIKCAKDNFKSSNVIFKTTQWDSIYCKEDDVLKHLLNWKIKINIRTYNSTIFHFFQMLGIHNIFHRNFY